MSLFKRVLFFVGLIFSNMNLFGQYQPEKYPIIPKPMDIQALEGFFTFDKQTKISYSNEVGKSSAIVLQQSLMDIYALSLEIQRTQVGETNTISFDIDSVSGQEESYDLDVSPTGIRVKASNSRGAFYAIQTLMQLYNGAEANLTNSSNVSIPAVQISDHPALGYRGLLLDVARYYMPIPAIKKYIDLMAYYKMNNLHLHLTDDQGWRIEIKKYPKLHEIGSWRKETLTNHHLFDSVQMYDGQPHGGYYRQEELKDLVKYAEARFVTIIPEIEMPGHSQAALAAYPQLGCRDTTYEVSTRWGIHKEILCPSEYTFNFLEDVLLEVMEIFPSKYIHIGGDETPQDRWKESDFCQQLIQEKGLKDEDGLQNYFMQRMSKFLSSHGRQAVAWYWDAADHMANDEKPVILSWQGEEAGISAVQRKDYTIMTPHLYTYLDYYQTEQGRAVEPLSIANFLPLEKVYAYQPFPDIVSEESTEYILGVQACLWAEYIDSEEVADYKLFPRFCALAEVAWLNNSKEKDFDDFARRLRVNVAYLDRLGVNYREAYFKENPADGINNKTVLRLAPHKNNPRNSEGDFLTLNDGRILLVYSRYFGTSDSDHGTAELAARYSSDQGKTWTTHDQIIVKQEGKMNVMSVSLLRLQDDRIALFYLRKNAVTDCIPMVRYSSDEGTTWTDPIQVITDKEGYFVLNNNRVIQLENGRLIMAVALHHTPNGQWQNKADLYAYYSDDGGKTWVPSAQVPNRTAVITQEPGLVELTDGRLLMYIRASGGEQQFSYSKDKGQTWSHIEASNIRSPLSPATIARVPQTGDLLMVWNNKSGDERRTPLTAAISKDEGKTWQHVKNIENDPDGWYCYTAIHFVGDEVLLAYCAGSQSKKTHLNVLDVRKITLDWFYE